MLIFAERALEKLSPTHPWVAAFGFLLLAAVETAIPVAVVGVSLSLIWRRFG